MKMLLTGNSIAPAVSQLNEVLRGEESATLELGAGTGIVSLVLASLLQRFTHQGKRSIWATDLGSALEIMNSNFSANANLFPDIDLKATELDWEEEVPDAITPHVDGTARKFDVIILADVTYNQVYFEALSSTLAKLMSPDTLVLFAYKERDSAERTFWDMLKAMDIILEHVENISGAGGAPVEIWLGRRDSRN